MNRIEVYSSRFCSYCVMAQRLLDKKDLSYETYHVDMEEGRRDEMIERSQGARTVPQIFINNQHIGGYTDLARLDREGKLDAMLAENQPG